jgi:hypothetical protein
MFKLPWQSEVQSSIQQDLTLDQVPSAMLQLIQEASSNYYRMGLLYNYVEDRKMAEAAGYASTQDYFRKNVREVSASALFMYGAVARAFSADTCHQFGVTRLSLLLTYKKALTLTLNHEEPGGTLIEVPGKKGEVTTKLFSECSVAELRKAIQRMRDLTSGTKPLPPAEVALGDRYVGAVTARFKKGDPLRAKVRNHEGMGVLDISGIPLSQVHKVAEALLAQPLGDAENTPPLM